VALEWNLVTVVNVPLGSPGRIPLYSCLPLCGSLRVAIFNTLATGPKWITRKLVDKKTIKIEGLICKEISTRNSSAGADSSSTPSRGAYATSQHAVEISAMGKDEPAVRYLPEVTLEHLFQESAVLIYLHNWDRNI
jgi:hypothetical protein